MELQSFDPKQSQKDIPNRREYDMANGNKYVLTRHDPYGFVKISLAKGNLPEYLKSDYTSFDKAKQAIDAYLRNKKT